MTLSAEVVTVVVALVFFLLVDLVFFYRSRSKKWKDAYLGYVRMYEDEHKQVVKLKARMVALEKEKGRSSCDDFFQMTKKAA